MESTKLGVGEIESESKMEGGDKSGTGLFGPKDQFKESKIIKFWKMERPPTKLWFENMQLESTKLGFGEMESKLEGNKSEKMESTKLGFGAKEGNESEKMKDGKMEGLWKMETVSTKLWFENMGSVSKLCFGDIKSKMEGGDKSGPSLTESTGLFGPKDRFKESRKFDAELRKIKKFFPKVLKKICPNPVNPNEDCLAMSNKVYTFQLSKPSYGEAIDFGGILSLHSNRPGPSYSSLKPHLFFRAPQAAEALKFYQASFGAQVMTIVKDPKRKADQEVSLIEAAEFKIGSDIYSLSDIEDESFLTSGFVSMMTDDIDGVVEKAMKAGADKEKMIRVYSACCVWCSVIKLIDPYGNIWMIYSKMCQSCLKSFVLLA